MSGELSIVGRCSPPYKILIDAEEMSELDQDGHTICTVGNVKCIACKAEYISTSQIPCTRTSIDTKVSVGTTVELERFPVSTIVPYNC